MNKYTKFLPLFKEDSLPGDGYALHESTRKTLQRHQTPVKLLNSAPGGLLLQRRVPEQHHALAAVSVPAVLPSTAQHLLKAWVVLNPGILGPPGRFSAANSKPQCLEKCYILFQRYDGCYVQKDMQVTEQREFLLLVKQSDILFFFPLFIQWPVSQFRKPMHSLMWLLEIKQNHICCHLNKKISFSCTHTPCLPPSTHITLHHLCFKNYSHECFSIEFLFCGTSKPYLLKMMGLH